MLNFWKCYLKCIRLMLSCSLGYADSENVSFVIFQNSVCPPYWSKWTTVFSLLLLENLSNSSQNCLRWSLDWAEQNLLNWFFVLIFVQKLWCCERQRRPKIGSEAVISANFDKSKRNLVCFINSMIWGSMPKLGTAPPMGIEIAKCPIFCL